MAKLFILVAACLVAASCAGTKYVPTPSETIVTEKVTFVPTPVPSDSVSIHAWLECDKNGKVVLSWLETEKSKNARLKFSLDSLGNMLAKMNTVPDTVYLPSSETVVERKVNVPYPVEKELTKWQSFKLDVGGYAIISVVSVLLIMFGKMVYKLKKGG